MRVIKTKDFLKWADTEGLTDKALHDAVGELEQGLFDANLGGNVYKKRIAIKNRGKRSGVRTIIATRLRGVVFYMYGFSKGAKVNISNRELKALKMLAKQLLRYSNNDIEKAITAGEFFEVKANEENDS